MTHKLVQIVKFVCERARNVLGKRENAIDAPFSHNAPEKQMFSGVDWNQPVCPSEIFSYINHRLSPHNKL